MRTCKQRGRPGEYANLIAVSVLYYERESSRSPIIHSFFPFLFFWENQVRLTFLPLFSFLFEIVCLIRGSAFVPPRRRSAASCSIFFPSSPSSLLPPPLDWMSLLRWFVFVWEEEAERRTERRGDRPRPGRQAFLCCIFLSLSWHTQQVHEATSTITMYYYCPTRHAQSVHIRNVYYFTVTSPYSVLTRTRHYTS